MNLPDDLAADLPAPRDDEPESLRQDIVDELADHLQCALHRELLAGGQASGRRQPADVPYANEHEQAAWHQVLTRFGSPSTIARQLWFDAMKERIMAQKLTATMATVAALACVLMCMLLWRTSLTQSHLQSRLEEQRALNASLMADLKSMLEDSSQAATNAGWAAVKVHLQSEAGEPVAGYVTIHGTAINAGNDNEINVYRATNTTGVADFGLLPFGNYEMEAVASAVGEEHRQSFMLSPNTPAEQTIVCPTEPPPAVDVSFAIDVPPPLHADRLVFIAMFQRSSRNTSTGSWNLSSRSDRSCSILFDSEGTILGEMGEAILVDDSARPPFGGFGGPAGGLSRSGSGGPRDLQVVEYQIIPARTIRSTDRCIGLGVAAKVEQDADDESTMRLVVAPEYFLADALPSESFADADPTDESMRIEFDPSSSFWEQVVAAFRRSGEVAVATFPEGWQIVRLPADVRIVRGATGRSRSGRGGSSSQSALQVLRLQVVTMLEVERLNLPVGVGDVVGPTQMPTSVRSPNEFRELMDGSRKVDVDLLVSPELAKAIELARNVGAVEAVRYVEDDADDIDENGVNQKSLEILRRLAAEQTAAKDE